MKTYLECYPCFMRQALDAARQQRLSDSDTREILVAVGESFRNIRLDLTPPEIAGTIYRIVRRHTQESDPYGPEKTRFTELAMAEYPRLSDLVRSSPEPLLAATVIAIVGNIIDFGVLNETQVRSRLDSLLERELSAAERESGTIFAFHEFSAAVGRASDLLYVGDNAGETVFDRILIEEIRRRRPTARIAYAVRGQPVLNDATMEDAGRAGLDEVAEVISSGSTLPGTVLSETTEQFQKHFQLADLVISKGQGNYESLSETDRELFFLLVAKCPVIARDIGSQEGDIILLHRHR
jgi:uncharacterized protein with ATP-grasp and redox domains